MSIIFGDTMDIVAIMGSPRKHGNTDMLLDEMIKGAEENGNTVKKYCEGNAVPWEPRVLG